MRRGALLLLLLNSAPTAWAQGSEWRTWWELNRELHRQPSRIICYVDPPAPDPWSLRVTEEQVSQVSKALREVLHESDPELLGGALLALGEIGDPSPVEPSALEPLIRPFLSNTDAELRETALIASAILAAPEAIPALTALLVDDDRGRELLGARAVDPRTRLLAAYCLGRVGGCCEDSRRGEVWQILRRLLETTRNNPALEVACVQALGRVGPHTGELPPGNMTESERLEFLFSLLIDGARDPYLRGQAAREIARSLEHLTGDHGPRWSERLAEVLAAGAGSPEAPSSLRRQCVLSLGTVGGQASSPELRARIADSLRAAASQEKDPVSAGYALLALAELGSGSDAGEEETSAAAGCLIARLDGAVDLRPWAALACGHMGWRFVCRSDFHPVLDALRAAVRRRLVAGAPDLAAYVLAAGLLVDGGAVPWLTEQMNVGPPDLQREIASAFRQWEGYIGPRRTEEVTQVIHGAVERLRSSALRSVHDSQLFVRVALARKALGDRELGPDLLAGLSAADSAPAACVYLDALAVTDSGRALEPLLARLRDKDQPLSVRVHAARALGELANKEVLPWSAAFARDLDFSSAPPALFDPAQGSGILNNPWK